MVSSSSTSGNVVATLGSPRPGKVQSALLPPGEPRPLRPAAREASSLFYCFVAKQAFDFDD